jgi:hypothetical protein
MKHNLILMLAWGTIILFSLCQAKHENNVQGKEGVEIVKNAGFKGGFRLSPMSPAIIAQGGTYRDTLDFGEKDVPPQWRLAQWHSRLDLSGALPITDSDGAIAYSNEVKRVAIYPDRSLLLELNASKVYDKPRIQGQDWPHLLIGQSFDGRSPIVGLSDSIVFSYEIKLVKCENMMGTKTYDPNLHTAHTPSYLILKNDNKNSKDYGLWMWFGFSSFDYRYPSLSDKVKMKWDAKTNAYIYNNPPIAFWGDVNLHDRQWHKGRIDIKPYALKALEAMKGKECFLDTGLDDLKVTGMNFGWEIPGTFDAAIIVKNISLKAY